MPKGITMLTDIEIVRLWNEGKFVRQICREYKVGIKRVRRVVRGVSP